jgi:hypothetical protein
MCHPLMMGVAEFRGDIADHFPRRRLALDERVNPTVSVMPADAVKFQVTSGFCSCSR